MRAHRGEHLRQSRAVRRRRRPGSVSPRPRARPRPARRAARGPGVDPAPRRGLPAGVPDLRRGTRAVAAAGRRGPPRPLLRRGHGGDQAAGAVPTAARLLRPQGCPATGGGAPAHRRPRPAGRHRRLPDGARRRRRGPELAQCDARAGRPAARGCPPPGAGGRGALLALRRAPPRAPAAAGAGPDRRRRGDARVPERGRPRYLAGVAAHGRHRPRAGIACRPRGRGTSDRQPAAAR